MDTRNWKNALLIEERNKPYARLFIAEELSKFALKHFSKLNGCQYEGLIEHKWNVNAGTSIQSSGIDLTMLFFNPTTKTMQTITVEEKYSESYFDKKISLEIINHDRINNCEKPGWTATCSADIIVMYHFDKTHVIVNNSNLKGICMDWYRYWKANYKSVCKIQLPCTHKVGNYGTQTLIPSMSEDGKDTWMTAYIKVTDYMITRYFDSIMEIYERGLLFYKEKYVSTYINS